jgi:hypothetical protein
MIYLASPYSSLIAEDREHRYQQACRAVVHLMRNGCIEFSPIVHAHPLVQYGLPYEWLYWELVDRAHIQLCDEVVVLKLDGLMFSRGVQAEIKMARELGKPIGYLTWDAITVAELAPHTSEVQP